LDERQREFRVRAAIQRDLFVVQQPVESAPGFDAEHAGGALGGRQRPDRFQTAQQHGHMRVVLVERLVQINLLRSAGGKDGGEIRPHAGMAGFFHIGARVSELELQVVAAEAGGLALLLNPHLFHLLVGVVGKKTAARRAGAVGHDHAGEETVGVAIAFGDGRPGVDLNVILVGDDTEMGRAREGRGGIAAGGRENVGFGAGEFHGRETCSRMRCISS